MTISYAVADIALEQTEYEFTEQGEPLQVCINITNNVTVEANFSITVRTDADEGTADVGDFERFEKEIMINTGQTCFDVIIFLDAILEDDETFRVSMESTDSALNVVVPQAEVTIFDGTSEFILQKLINSQWLKKKIANCLYTAVDIALEQTEYQFAEQIDPFEVCIIVTNNVTIDATFSITVRTDVDDGNADREDFEMFEKEIMINTGQTCF